MNTLHLKPLRLAATQDRLQDIPGLLAGVGMEHRAHFHGENRFALGRLDFATSNRFHTRRDYSFSVSISFHCRAALARPRFFEPDWTAARSKYISPKRTNSRDGFLFRLLLGEFFGESAMTEFVRRSQMKPFAVVQSSDLGTNSRYNQHFSGHLGSRIEGRTVTTGALHVPEASEPTTQSYFCEVAPQ